MKSALDLDKVAKGLGAERLGKVDAKGGYFAAVRLVSELEYRFRVPAGGGRPTDPNWTERRLLPLSPRTLERLERISALVRTDRGLNIEPMQLAALLIEQSTEQLSRDDASKLVRSRRGVRARQTGAGRSR